MAKEKTISGIDLIETVDFKTGEVTREEKHTKIKFKVEEDYNKLYLRSLSVVSGLPTHMTGTLNEVLKRVNYENEIVLVSSIKKRMAHSLGIKLNTLDHHIGGLVKKKILIRIDRGIFRLNTYIFGRGKWVDIIKHREGLGMAIEFKDDGHGKTEVTWKTTESLDHSTSAKSS